MDPVAAKYIGAGIACLGMGLAGVGVGNIFANFLGSALRNPSAAQGQFGNLIFGFAVTTENGKYTLVKDLPIDDFSQKYIDKTLAELEEERSGVAHLLG